VAKAVRPYRKVKEVQFTSDPRVFNLMWDVRRGIIPSAGAMRPVSTSVILEGTSQPPASIIIIIAIIVIIDVASDQPSIATPRADASESVSRRGCGGAAAGGHDDGPAGHVQAAPLR
jgi:hypothetical protein